MRTGLRQGPPRHNFLGRRGSADDLVGLEEEHRRNGEAQGLGGFQVEEQIELVEQLHGLG